MIPSEPALVDGTLRSQIEARGTSLRLGLQPIVEETAGVSARPSRLTQRLGLDKSLASRLVRALKCDSDLEFIHRVPSPSGLRMVLARARDAGIDPALIETAETEVERFQEFIRSTPGGMDAIQAHISDTSRDVRETREHVAKQAAYKAMSFLLGYYCDTLTTSLILTRSENGRNIDGVEVHQRVGMHRLRPRTPIALLSVLTTNRHQRDQRDQRDQREQRDEGGAWIEALDGRVGPAEPSRYILADYSTDPVPRLEILEEGSHTTFVLQDPDPKHDAGISVTSAFRIRQGWPRFRSEETDHAARAYVLPTPCRTLVRDLYIADDVWPGASPEMEFQLMSPAGRRAGRPRGLAAQIQTLDLAAPVEHLRPGPNGFALRGQHRYRELLSDVFARIGQDPARFRGYRCSIAYPVPLVEMVWWVKLPEAPRV